MNTDVLLYDYALSFLGLPYKWAGDDPIDGYDCSGLVCELLTAAGVIPHKSDFNSQALYNTFVKEWTKLIYPIFGAVAFYGRGMTEISHVAFCLDAHRVIEAGGGSSKTLSRNDAASQNAFIRIRPVNYRHDFLTLLRPRYLYDSK